VAGQKQLPTRGGSLSLSRGRRSRRRQVGEGEVSATLSRHHLARTCKNKGERKGMASDAKASLDESRTDSDDFESGEYCYPPLLATLSLLNMASYG
jgi:hypothetical protein